MKRLFDDLVVRRSVVVTRVDVRDTEIDDVSQHRDRFVAILRGPEDPGRRVASRRNPFESRQIPTPD